jgi:gliding motility-associated-like protein
VLNRDFDIDTPSIVSLSIVPEIKLDEGQTFRLMPVFGTRQDSIAWIKWSPSDFLSCDDCPEPEIINPDRDLEYTVTYANLNGCTATARVKVSIIKRGIWFPTAISPNGDGVNDSFFPVVTEDSYKEIRMMKIFDRWGNQVFFRQNLRPNTPEDGWDGSYKGQLLNPGVYVWMAEIEWKNGETQIFQGDLTILR